MEIYEKSCITEGPLRTGGLFRLMQDAAEEHCDRIGLGNGVIDPLRLMWVVIRQYVELPGYPEPGQRFLMQTWPGNTRHMFFPRFYRLYSASGEPLGAGSAIWALVDRDTRKMIRPGEYGLAIEGLVTGGECRLPAFPDRLPAERTAEYTVPSSVLDSNGHMNNTKYYDLAESVFGLSPGEVRLRRAMTEYLNEALEGERMSLNWGREGRRYYIAGSSGQEKALFSMSLEYTERKR